LNLKDGVDASGRPAKVSVEVGRLQEKKENINRKDVTVTYYVPILIRGRVSTSSPANTGQMLMGTGKIHPRPFTKKIHPRQITNGTSFSSYSFKLYKHKLVMENYSITKGRKTKIIQTW